jgi:hypothetical protein
LTARSFVLGLTASGNKPRFQVMPNADCMEMHAVNAPHVEAV